MSDDDLCLLCGHERAEHFDLACYAKDCDCDGFLDPETC